MPRGKIPSFLSALVLIYVKRGTGSGAEGATLLNRYFFKTAVVNLSLDFSFICQTVA
jgi:hypothetical protein